MPGASCHNAEKFINCQLDGRIFACEAEKMISLRTVLVSSLVCLCASAGMLRAQDDLVKSFASCAGRYSAEMEHAWLINDPKAEDLELRRSGFVELLEATTTAANAQFVLHHRINTKHAHARLLQTASFHSDTDESVTARKLALRLLEQCELLILGGA
ncbi:MULTISPECIES: hypothetical protein [unclassified Ruegeria]|uniref:hypothetical protein n=1 Tax=unclassified Ruegeria TaxID=2625375 RepID=UPI001489E6D9|nr:MULTISPECIES: hypothetical protein [unclassified Ruegeria]